MSALPSEVPLDAIVPLPLFFASVPSLVWSSYFFCSFSRSPGALSAASLSIVWPVRCRSLHGSLRSASAFRSFRVDLGKIEVTLLVTKERVGLRGGFHPRIIGLEDRGDRKRKVAIIVAVPCMRDVDRTQRVLRA